MGEDGGGALSPLLSFFMLPSPITPLPSCSSLRDEMCRRQRRVVVEEQQVVSLGRAAAAAMATPPPRLPLSPPPPRLFWGQRPRLAVCLSLSISLFFLPFLRKKEHMRAIKVAGEGGGLLLVRGAYMCVFGADLPPDKRGVGGRGGAGEKARVFGGAPGGHCDKCISRRVCVLYVDRAQCSWY